MFPNLEIEEICQYVAEFLSILIIFLSVIMKVPQINHIRDVANTKGISTAAVVLEILGYTFVIAYNNYQNYNIMTYLEYPILLVQLYILMFYILKYRKLLSDPVTLLLVMTYFAFTVGLFVGTIPGNYIPYLVTMSPPLSGISKIGYMYAIVHTRNSDAVSLTTWAISAGTNIARIFTVLMDSGDSKLIFNLSIAAILSISVFMTALSYKFPKFPQWNKTPRYVHAE